MRLTALAREPRWYYRGSMASGRGGRAAVALASLCAACAACSLFTDLGGFDERSAPDAARPDVDTTGEAGAATIADAAARDADGDGDAATPPVACGSAAAVFCDDFDRDDPVGSWDGLTNVGGSVSIGPLLDHPQALVTSVVATDAGQAPLAQLSRSLTGARQRFSLEADIYYDARPTNIGEYHNLARVRMVRENGGVQLFYLTASAANALVLHDFPDGTPATLSVQPISLPPGVWHRVQLVAEIGGSTRLFIDGGLAVQLPTPAWMTAGTISIQVGVTGSVLPSSPITVGTDNVRFTAD